jgi:hypothetical protein
VTGCGALLWNDKIYNVQGQNLIAAKSDQMFASVVDGGYQTLKIMGIHHVVGIFEKVDITLL